MVIRICRKDPAGLGSCPVEKCLIFRLITVCGMSLPMYDIFISYALVDPIACDPVPFQPSPSLLVCMWRVTKTLIQSEMRVNECWSRSAKKHLGFQKAYEGTL